MYYISTSTPWLHVQLSERLTQISFKVNCKYFHNLQRYVMHLTSADSTFEAIHNLENATEHHSHVSSSARPTKSTQS